MVVKVKMSILKFDDAKVDVEKFFEDNKDLMDEVARENKLIE